MFPSSHMRDVYAVVRFKSLVYNTPTTYLTRPLPVSGRTLMLIITYRDIRVKLCVFVCVCVYAVHTYGAYVYTLTARLT